MATSSTGSSGARRGQTCRAERMDVAVRAAGCAGWWRPRVKCARRAHRGDLLSWSTAAAVIASADG